MKTLVCHIFNEFRNIFIILCFNYNNRLHLLTYLFYNHDLQHRNMARRFSRRYPSGHPRRKNQMLKAVKITEKLVLSHIWKMITHILTIKLQNKPEEQFHFRQDIGTRYAIGVVLRTISERLIDFNSEFVSPTRINRWEFRI